MSCFKDSQCTGDVEAELTNEKKLSRQELLLVQFWKLFAGFGVFSVQELACSELRNNKGLKIKKEGLSFIFP